VCTANGCSHVPDSTGCAPGESCDAQLGCIECKVPSDCDDKLTCTTDDCIGGRCSHTPNCPAGYCDPTLNKCVSCTSDADCQGGVVTAGGAQPAIIGTKCMQAACQQGMCVDVLVVCAADQTCCPPFGCTNSNFCNIMTQ
jgi:hypothetical protein